MATITSSSKLGSFVIGAPRRRGEGLRIGAVRNPPRGVPTADYSVGDYFDLWLPVVSPSRELRDWFKTTPKDEKALRRYLQRYKRDMQKSSDARQTIVLLAHMALRTPISVGCYCTDEDRCHRKVLLELIEEAQCLI
jgi:uncharacterized protein YeaO (DUF488 family)